MIRLSQVRGQRVMARDGAQIVGSVRRLLVDVVTDSVVALQLEGTSDGRTIVEWSDLAAIGPDALIVESEDVRRGPLSVIEQDFVGGKLDLPNKLVLTDAGDAVGRLTDLAFDEASGHVTEIEVPGHVLPLSGLVALGPYALIVASPD